MSALAALSTGSLDAIRKSSDHTVPGPLVLQVSDLEANGRKHKCVFSDGVSKMPGALSTQLAHHVIDGHMHNGAILRATCVANDINGLMLMCTELEVLHPGEGAAASSPPAATSPTTVALTAGAMEVDGEATVKLEIREHATPCGKPSGMSAKGGLPALSPGYTPSPSDDPRFRASKTPLSRMAPATPNASLTPTPMQTPTLSSKTPSSAPRTGSTPASTLLDRKKFDKIDALHPYSDTWCLRAKLGHKGMLRTTKSGSVMTVELVDDLGKQIQGTFWRTAADKWAEQLQEGTVYVWNKFNVKPSNKQYSNVKCDYEINFTDKTEIIEAADQDTSAMTAAVDLVPFDQLPRHITRKAPIDVLGIVLQLGSLGTVKRKADQSELARRDVTLGDATGKSVVLTLWGENATERTDELDKADGTTTLLQVTACRVTDFNGCSISSLTKSAVSVDPDSTAAEALRAWYAEQGSSFNFSPIGQEAAALKPGATGGPDRDNLVHLSAIAQMPAEKVPAPSDKKGLYNNTLLHVAMIDSEKAMSYLANPENGRKVEPSDGDRFFCPADGSYCDRAERRYTLKIRAIDSTGQAYLGAFNEAGVTLMLGKTADQLEALKESDNDAFQAAVKAAQWNEWAVTVQTKGSEYNGEVRAKHVAYSVRPINFVSDSLRLVNLINRYTA